MSDKDKVSNDITINIRKVNLIIPRFREGDNVLFVFVIRETLDMIKTYDLLVNETKAEVMTASEGASAVMCSTFGRILSAGMPSMNPVFSLILEA